MSAPVEVPAAASHAQPEPIDAEVLVPLDLPDAERLDKRLRLMATAARNDMEKVGHLLDEARRGQVHQVLGFRSWPDYVANALGGTLQLSGEARKAIVQLMSLEGLSERAIAEATGASKTTVHRDLEVVRCGPPDGDHGSHEPGTVTGRDGKTHPKHKPTPRKSPRLSFSGEFVGSVQSLSRPVEKVQKLVADDRFAEYVKSDDRVHANRRALVALIAALQRIVDELPDDGLTDEKS